MKMFSHWLSYTEDNTFYSDNNTLYSEDNTFYSENVKFSYFTKCYTICIFLFF